MHGEAAGVAKPLKQKTSRADRRAIQEAQRAAKSAAREAGSHWFLFSLLKLCCVLQVWRSLFYSASLFH